MANNKIPFNGTTNYPDVYRVTQLMFGDIVGRGTKCCQSPQVKEALCNAVSDIKAADIADGLSDVDRYDDAVKSAYLTLYPYSMDKDYNYQPL